MKKIIALVLMITLILSVLTACATSTPKDGTQSAASENSNELNDLTAASGDYAPTGMKIGFVYSPESDSLSRTYRYSLKYITNAFGCEVIFTDMLDSSTEAMIGYYENLIQQGAEGLIMIQPPSVAFLKELESKGIYYTFIDTGDPDIQEFLKTAEYFCGKLTSMDNSDPDRGVGYDMTWNMLNCLYEAECRNIVYVGWEAGDADHAKRYLAWTEFQKSHDVTAVAEYRGTDAASGVSDILASYGTEINGICVTDSSFAAVASAVISAGLQDKIKMSSFDMNDFIPDLMKDDVIVGVGGGNTAFFELCFVMIYNRWSGADDILSVDADKRIPIPNLFVINSQEQYKNYETFFIGELPAFTADEMKQLCSHYYPDTTVQEKNDYLWWLADAENYNIDAVAERHANLVG